MRNVLLLRDDCYLFDPRTYPANDCCEKELNDLVTESGASLLTAILSNSSISTKKLTAIDQFCLANYQNWPTNKQLYVMDIWHTVKHARRATNTQKITYTQQMQQDFLNDIVSNTDIGQMLQMLYYVSFYRTPLHWQHVQSVQRRLLDCRGRLTLDEQSIFCAALIRSGSKAPNSVLVDGLISSLWNVDLKNGVSRCNEVTPRYNGVTPRFNGAARCNEVAISSLAKAIRWYSTPDNISRTKDLQEKLVAYTKVADIKGITHIGLLGYNLGVFNYDLVELIVRRFLAELDAIRIKDVERAWLILSTLSASKFYTEDGTVDRFSEQVQEFLIRSLQTQHPDTLINCITYLAIYAVNKSQTGAHQVIRTELIDWALSVGLAACKRHKKVIIAELFLVIDCYAKISLGETYKGSTLPANHMVQLKREAFTSTDKSIGHNKDISGTIERIFISNGFDMMTYRIVPYSNMSELIFLYDEKTNKTIRLPKIPENSEHILNAKELSGSRDGVKAVAIVTSSWQQQLHGKRANHGLFQYKLNQLRALGYYTMVIRQQDWKNCENFEAKQRLLIRLLGRHDIFVLDRLY